MPDLSTITPVTREEEFLDRIARAAASPNLPEVDASDNGDVLTVVSGEWAAAAPAGGLPEVTSSNNGQVLTVVSGEWATAAPASCSCTFNVEVSEDPDNPGKYILNKTYNEIIGAYTNGKILQFVFLDGDEHDFLPLMVINSFGGSYTVMLSDPNHDFSSGKMTFNSSSADGVLLFDPGN